MNNKNPLLEKNTDKYNSIPFSKIKTEHFIPALYDAIKDVQSNILNITNSKKNPTFNNTVLSLEIAFDLLEHIVTIYYHYFASIASDEIRELVGEVSAINTDLNNDIFQPYHYF